MLRFWRDFSFSGGKPTRKNPPKIDKKTLSEQVFLNNFHWVPDSCHREEGKSSRELFEKARVNAVSFGISGFGVGFWASIVEVRCDPNYRQEKKKEHKAKLLGPDIFRWGGGVPCAGILPGYPRVAPEKLEKEKVSVQVLAPIVRSETSCE